MSDSPQRPTRKSPDVRRAACDQLMQEIQNWNGWNNQITTEDLIRSAAYDGYHFAKNLDRGGYLLPDADLVEVLDSYCHMVTSAEDAAVAKWVSASGGATP